MWAVAVTLGAALGLAAGGMRALSAEYRAASTGWRLLAHSGWPLSLAGALFVLRFWTPTHGPFRTNVRYPFGSYVNAWAVSFGFTWIAFGILLAALAILASRAADARPAWCALLAAWIVCWLPHAVIALGFAVGGTDPRSLTDYRGWAAQRAGGIILGVDAALLLLHVGLSVAGFLVAGRAAWRRDA